MNGKRRLMKWVSVSMLVVAALMSTVGSVGAIHLVEDPTVAGSSSWTRFQQYQAAVENDLATLEALSGSESSGASRGLAAARPSLPSAAAESSWTRFQQVQAAVENDLAALESPSGGASKGGWERFAEYLWASGVTR